MRLCSISRSPLNTLLVFELEDGYTVESVLYRGDSLCVSSQVGCNVGCIFCASGRYGFYRNLSWEEIVNQYYIASSIFPEIKRIAMAGIGEVLHNWENCKKVFFKFKKEGLKVSFYTSGFPLSKLEELLDLPHNGVTISIHTLDPFLRNEIMKHSGDVEELLEFLRNKVKQFSEKKKKKISLGYLLMKGINDSMEDIERLGNVASELGLGVTLLHCNDVGFGIEPVDEETYERIFLYLRNIGVRVTLSNRFRKDSLGGCGTLTVNRYAVKNG